jgi:hypothetical protein
VCSSLNVRDHVSHPCRTAGRPSVVLGCLLWKLSFPCRKNLSHSYRKYFCYTSSHNLA